MKKTVPLWPILILMIFILASIMLGFSARAALLTAFLLVIPAIFICIVILIFRHPRGLSPETLHTRGMPLDILASVYDRYCLMVGLGQAFRQETMRHAELKAGDRVLDAGCGTGVLTRLAAEAAGEEGVVVGIDPSAKMIEAAKRNADKEGSRAKFRLAAIEDLPFAVASFDCVLSSLMLHHLPPDLKAKGLAEAYRVLKPGGRLVLVDADRPSNPIWWVLLWPLLYWPFTRDQISGRLGVLMSTSGFTRIEKVGVWGGFLGFWKAYKGR